MHLRLALAASVAFAGGAVLFPTPAQAGEAIESIVLNGKQLALTSDEEKALLDLGRAIADRRDRPVQDSKLAKARQAARSPDALYALGLYEMEMARQWNDDRLREPALDRLIASKSTPPDKLAGYLATRGQIAFELRDLEAADALWTRLVGMKPTDPDALANLAQVRQARKDSKGAADLLERAAAAQTAAGENPPEARYRQRLVIASQARLADETIAAARELLTHYPTSRNWREALVMHRQLTAPAGELEIDHLRLMRSIGSLAKADEYQRMAQLLVHSGRAAEARTVLGEGLSRGLLDARGSPTHEIIAEVDRGAAKEAARLDEARRRGWGSATAAQLLSAADSLLGLGRHSEAAELYRAALGKPGAEPDLLNLRLGVALVGAARPTEAGTAFQAVAAGPAGYRDLAIFWTIWLKRPPA